MTQSMTRLGQLIAREKSRFLRFIRRRLLDSGGMDADDILSEVTYNVLRRGDVIGEVENLSAYLYRALANRITDYQRKREPTVLALDGQDADPSSNNRLPADPGLPPDDQLQHQELQQRLAFALNALSAAERAVWIATEIDDRGFRELAEEWDEPIGTLLSRKSRASAKLRQMLSEYREP